MTSLEFNCFHCRSMFVLLAMTLAGFGLLMVQSASLTSRPSISDQVFVSKHLLALGIGIALALLIQFVPANWWSRLSSWMLAFTLLLLAAVCVPGLGKSVNGATRWLTLGPVQFQPSEFAKLALPLYLASLLVTGRSAGWIGWLRMFLPTGLIVGLVIVQPDLGTAVFLLLISGLTLYLGGWPMHNFLLLGGGLVPLLITLFSLKPYQLQRISGFLETWRDVDRAPYQIRQAFISIGEGGWWGVGLGHGWQKLGYLPEANTDFVFAVVAEELGIVGAIGIIVTWTALFWCGWKMLSSLPERSFGFVAGLVLLTQLVFQAALNVAVVTALVPPKGISHPLISYGGSNLVVSLLALGLIYSFSAPTETGKNQMQTAGKSVILLSESKIGEDVTRDDLVTHR